MSKAITGETVRIFPVSGRAGISEYNNWLSEYNLSSLINQLINPSSNGFVISDSFEADEPFEFNIQGYYFMVSKASQLIEAAEEETKEGSTKKATHLIDGCNYVKFIKDSENNYYAVIKIGGVPPYYVLKDWTKDTVENEEAPAECSLKLLTAAKVIPDKSRIQFNGLKTISGQGVSITLEGSAITNFNIDDGELA